MKILQNQELEYMVSYPKGRFVVYRCLPATNIDPRPRSIK
jgi:hypothetical protein